MKCTYRNITFEDNDVVELDDWIPANEYNPHNVRPWLLHDHGFTLCIVFASSLQDALDIAVDNNKLDSFRIEAEDYEDYNIESDNPTCSFLGNAGEPFDIDCISYLELPNPKRSFCAQFKAHQFLPGNRVS